MDRHWETEIERRGESSERAREIQETEQRLLEAQEASRETTQVSEQQLTDAEAVREEAKHLAPSEFSPEVGAEARLMGVERAGEVQEEQRLDAAAEGIEQIDCLKPKAWTRLDKYQRRVTLDLAGRELTKVYRHPSPPLIITERSDDRRLQGEYNDEDYWIFMNRAAEANRETKLFGDDPVPALRTYAHEWRHSYQWEQATGWETMPLVDDPDKAMRWSWNIKDYKEPPDETLDKTDHQRYQKEFEAYREQPVEKDANRFADELVKRVYGHS